MEDFNIKGEINISLPITQQQFNEGAIKFIYKYGRLPYLSEDDIEVEIENDNGELEARPYRANKYIKEYYNNQDKMTEYFLDNKIITYKIISDCIGLDEDRVNELINKKVKQIDISQRRKLHIFFEKDFYKEEGEFNELCLKCKKRCKQEYWVSVIGCPKYESKNK